MDKGTGPREGFSGFFIRHAWAIFIIATLVCLALIARLTNALNPQVVGVWITVGILTTLLLSGVALVVILGAAAVRKARTYVLAFEPDKELYAKDRYERERVHIADFYSKYAAVHEGKTFVDCEILGPGAIYLHENCDMPQLACSISDFIVIRQGDVISAAAHFSNTSFRNCKFSNVVVFATEETAKSIQQACRLDTGMDLPVVGL